MAKQILTPDHHAWTDFIDALSAAVNAYLEHFGKCQCGGKLKSTKQILKTIPNIDVEESLAFIKENYGECDRVVLTIANSN